MTADFILILRTSNNNIIWLLLGTTQVALRILTARSGWQLGMPRRYGRVGQGDRPVEKNAEIVYEELTHNVADPPGHYSCRTNIECADAPNQGEASCRQGGAQARIFPLDNRISEQSSSANLQCDPKGFSRISVLVLLKAIPDFKWPPSNAG
jgi:hypothetical protein